MVRGRIIIICGIVLALGVGLRLWMNSGSAHRPARAARPATAPTEATEPGRETRRRTPRPSMPPEEISLKREELEALNTGPWGRNPFLTPQEEAPLPPPERVVEGPSGLAPIQVRAILVSEGKRIAMIDGRVVAEGDLIGEEEVLEIRPRAVVLRKGTQTRTVEMQLPAIEVQSAPAPMGRGMGSKGGKW